MSYSEFSFLQHMNFVTRMFSSVSVLQQQLRCGATIGK